MNEKKVLKAVDRLDVAIDALCEVWVRNAMRGADADNRKKLNKLAVRIFNKADKIVLAARALADLTKEEVA